MSGQTKIHGYAADRNVFGHASLTPQHTNGGISPHAAYTFGTAYEMENSAFSFKGSEKAGKTYINSNVTPRSGARRARQESLSPQQKSGGTGSRSSRPTSAEKQRVNGGAKGTRVAEPYEIPLPSRPRRSGSDGSDASDLQPRLGQVHARSDTTMSAPVSDGAPKFFHADDAPPSKRHKVTSPELPVRPNSTSHTTSKPSQLKTSPVPGEDKSKFFYANEIPEVKSGPSYSTLINGLHKKPTSPVIQSVPHPYTPQPARPSSPLKEEILMDSPESVHSSPFESPEHMGESGTNSRRSSLSHNRSKVTGSSSISSPTERKSTHGRKSSLNANRGHRSSLSNVQNDKDGLRSPPAPRLGRLFESDHGPAKERPMSPPQSPVKGQSQLDHLNELAAKARRERKVLDLEISNSSLLAINQTLEREMRKMTRELRHFRRLSRPGRAFSSQIPRKSADGVKPEIVDDDFSEASDSEDEDEDEDVVDHRRIDTSVPIDPEKAPSDNARKFKDRVVQPLDLGKQQKWLEESQNLNEIIRRCLGVSENLLKGGKEALESIADTTESEPLGPRVLSLDEITHEVGERRQGLLTPVLEPSNTNPWERGLDRAQQSDPQSADHTWPSNAIDFNQAPADPNAALAAEDAICSKPQIPDVKDESVHNIDDDGDVASSAASLSSSAPARSASFSSPEPGIGPSDALHKLQAGHEPAGTSLEPSSFEGTEPEPKPGVEHEPNHKPVPEVSSRPSHYELHKEGADNIAPTITDDEPLPAETKEAPPQSDDNTAGNRSSVTKYLTSLWSGASKLRPP